MKRMNLELGGKTPMIVFDDAALDSTIPLLVAGVTTFAGQFCMAGSRILVQRGIADQVREQLRELTHSAWSSVPATEKTTQMGPLIDAAAVARVDQHRRGLGQLRHGDRPRRSRHRRTARLRRLLPAQPDRGRGLRTLPIIQQEVFGPVATFEIFDDEDDAIHRANATEFGLAAAVFTRDVDRARRVSRQINAGTVWTNTWFAVNDGFEEGGYKQSGIGRLRGAHGLAQFQEIKTYVHVVPPASH